MIKKRGLINQTRLSLIKIKKDATLTDPNCVFQLSQKMIPGYLLVINEIAEERVHICSLAPYLRHALASSFFYHYTSFEAGWLALVKDFCRVAKQSHILPIDKFAIWYIIELSDIRYRVRR